MWSGKYEALLDPEYRDYVDRIDAFFPPDIAGKPIAEQRAAYDAMCRALHPGRPAGVTASDAAIAAGARTIPIRLYEPERSNVDAVILYFHGGGFVLGNLDSHDDVCAELCAGAGLTVVSVDYRLAPEDPHPAAFEDAVAAFDWLCAETTSAILLAGESAGGNLAATVVHATRGRLRAASGQLLIYPGLGGDMTARSYVDHSRAPLLTVAEVAQYRRLRAGGDPPARDPTFEPLADTSFAGLPPTMIVTAECDPLSSDGEAYRDRIRAAGGQAEWREEPRLTHSFLRARATVPRAREAFERIVSDVAVLLAASRSRRAD